jgi:topoisomerase-4 subunit A
LEEKTHNEDLNDSITNAATVDDLYQNWFIDYASYVILERAVPSALDGLKPVQRRILHAMYEMDDGRYNKVANIIGQTMQYHPHGDASIGDAIVNMGQKDLLIDTQGNWGDVRTGDGAAAPRYIEARLSKFALEVLFNPQTTDWQLSYDGRKKEPIVLPVKFPLLLAQGVEGIAVGLSTKVLPHNFIEICEASVAFLKGKKFDLYPDFNTGGQIDISNYNDGRKGSKVRVRARIEDLDKKILVIKDIPFGTTTASLMESIVKANEAGKIKIKKVIDNTAKDVEIQVHLAPGVSPDITIEALYAFTECEVSISPNACVIIDDKPSFLGVSDLLRICTESTMNLLKKELEIRRHELLEKLLFASLEKIFIENRIYRNIEECETWEAVIQTIDEGLEPFKPSFYRTITRDDIIRLTEIKIKRISKYDSFKADELMRDMQIELDEVENNLTHLREYTILWFESLKKKYGKGRERKTEIKTFDTISAAVVAADNEKLYVNRAEGFIGYGIKKDEYICDCSDLDDIIVIRRDGKCKVVRIGEKVFVGKDILYAGVFRKGNDRMVYNLIYMDGKSGYSYVKRFQVLGITRDKEYDLTKGEKGSKVLYVSANPNGEAELVTVTLTPGSTARTKVFDFDFASQLIKGRDSQGNILTKYPIKKVVFKSAGVSTLGGIDIFYDNAIGKLNTEGRGALVGNFQGDDKILVLYKDGSYELTSFDLSNRYDESNILLLSKFDPNRVISAIYFDGGSKNNYLKRFKIETTTTDKKFLYISEAKNSKLLYASIAPNPVVEIHFRRDKSKTTEKALYDLAALMDVKGWKAMGNKITAYTITDVVEVAQEQPQQADADATEKGGQMSLFD